MYNPLIRAQQYLVVDSRLPEDPGCNGSGSTRTKVSSNVTQVR